MSKPVTMIELFYDLVFVYMISRATALIHHLEHGVIAPLALVAFVFVVIVFINSWMVQSVFINRFGQSSWTDIGFTFVDMMIVLYMANSFSAHLHANLQPFYIAAGLLSLTLCLQYLIVLVQTNNAADRNIARAFAAILGGRTLAFLIAGWLPGPLGTIIAVVGVVASWIAPAFTGRYTHQHPIIFGHLLERLTELSIVMFGETIVGIAGFFTQQRFSITSIIIFVIVASLFFCLYRHV
ncbi:low temperature requirement protein A [Lacticaseibacillus thailandensis]|uniref:low temperature requirement protein A n=1 Tax=Lacticaseibacillus thailandensis TaxID=381741 RepID=UPI000AA1715A|nr:low temperature requirement protein A [Lacticaseibacillus thailandensis]